MKAIRPLLLLLVGLVAASTSEPLAQVKKLAGRPEPAETPKVRLSGKARSYYLYLLAQNDLLNRNYLRARDHLEEAARSSPEDHQLALELARLYKDLQEPEMAMAEAQRAAQISPSAIEPRRLIAELLSEEVDRADEPSQQMMDETTAAYLALLEVDPSDGRARMSLAQIYFDRGSYMQAAEILRPMVVSDPSFAEAAFLLSESLLRAGQIEDAREVLERSIEASPDHPDLLRALAEAHERSGRPDLGAEVLEGLVRRHPNRPSFRFALARIYESMGNYRLAAREATVLMRALDGASPGSSGGAALKAAHLMFIESSSHAGDTEEALAAALRAERLFEDDPRFPLKRAELLFMDGRDEEAGAALEELAARDQGITKLRLSNVALRAGARKERELDYARAESLLRLALEMEPRNHAALNYLGYMLAERGEQLQEAKAFIEKALDIDGESGAYMDSLGWVLFRLGRLQEAEGPLLRAAELIPEEAVVHDHLGDLYRALGRTEMALEFWGKALSLGIEDRLRVQEKIDKAGGGPPGPPGERDGSEAPDLR